jgi:hypothetical protein
LVAQLIRVVPLAHFGAFVPTFVRLPDIDTHPYKVLLAAVEAIIPDIPLAIMTAAVAAKKLTFRM